MRSGFAVLMPMVLAGCVSAPLQWAQNAEFNLAVQDNPSLQRFDIVLTSKASTPLYLSKESWPDVAGLPLGFDGATLTTPRGTQDLLPIGSAYCPGGCGEVRIAPGQRIAGAIGYAVFGDATTIALESSRTLAATHQDQLNVDLLAFARA